MSLDLHDDLREAWQSTVPAHLRPQPARARPLADPPDVTPDGPLISPHRLRGPKTHHQAAALAERDRWAMAAREAGRTRKEVAAALRITPSAVANIEKRME